MKKILLAKRVLVALACGTFLTLNEGEPSLASAAAVQSKAPAETIRADQLSENLK